MVPVTQSVEPTIAKCLSCGYIGVSYIELKYGRGTWLIFGLMSVLLPGTCCIALCIDKIKDRYHMCSKCGNELGVYFIPYE